MKADTKNLTNYLALQLEFHQRTLQSQMRYHVKKLEISELEHQFIQQLSSELKTKYAELQEIRLDLSQMASNDAFLCGFRDGFKLRDKFDNDEFEKLRDEFLE